MVMHRRLFQVISNIVIITILFSAFPFAPAAAQGDDGLKREVNPQTGKVNFLKSESGQALSASKALGIFIHPQDPAMALAKRFAAEFGLKNPERDLKEMKSNHSEDGRITARYQQHYQGIPVMGGELIVHTNEQGDLYSMNGEVSTDLSLSTQPKIDSGRAKTIALQAVAKWYQKTLEDLAASEPELWIYDESLLRASTRPVELVWRTDVTPKDASVPVRELVLVNAHRGGISLHFNQIDTVWETPEYIKLSQPIIFSSPTDLQPNKTDNTNDLNANHMHTLMGATWYVSITGNDANSCSSPSNPCATINGAIGKASAGDAIKIAVGTYTGIGDEVVLINQSITLSGGWNASFITQGGQSTIDGQGARGALRVNSGVIATIERMVMQNGNSGSAAGIFNLGQLTINSSAISNNNGTGIYNYYMGTAVVINNSTIDNNTGGGILIAGGAVMNNVRISGNGGTGLYNTGDGTAIFNNSTISDNIGLYSGGMVSHSGTITLKNTIVAGNSSTFQDQGPDCIGPVLTAGYNLIGNSKDCEFTPTTGDLTDIDPRLGTLIGSPGYHPLQGISPAIDAGNPVAPGSDGNACLAADVRGITRPVGARCDIGAYEYDAPGGFTRIFVYSGDGQYVRPGLAFLHPLQVIMLDGQNKPVPNASVTFTAPASGPSGTFAATGTQITTVVTDANGIATTSTFTANTVLGAYTVVASATGVASVDFPLHNGFWTVAPTGSDINDCLTPATPCATINGAIEKASNGDTIYVSVGVFQGEAANVKVTKRLTILGGWDSSFDHQAGFSILDGHGTASHLIQFTKDSVVERLILRNGRDPLSIDCTNQVTLRQSSITGMSGSIVNCGILSFVNSTISNNRGGWGAILNQGTLTILNSTIANNASTSNTAGGINNSVGSVTIQNSILYGNLGSIRNPSDCDGLITSAGHNMIGTTIHCNLEVQASDQVGMDPKLGPLLSNGYFPLFVDSPAINAAVSCPPVDQRGVARLQGSGCDIGAYEYMAPGSLARLEIVGGNHQRAAPRLTFATPFKVVALDSTDNLVPHISITFMAPSLGPSGLFADTGTKTTTIMTDTNGIATAPRFTANSSLGVYTVTASANGAGNVDVSLQNFAFYVATIGNDSNSCLLPSAPCATIQAAVDKAVDNDTILIAAGTYFTMVHLEKGLTLSGGWNTGFTSQTGFSTLDGQYIRPGVYMETTVETAIDRFIIRNSRHHSGGAIYIPGLNIILTVTNSSIQNNRADHGGGIFSHGTLTLINTTVSHNTGNGGGGGIYNTFGTLTLQNSTISNNFGYYGGGIYNEGKLTINNSTISDNSAYYGGGIYHHGLNGEELKNSIVARNSVIFSGTDCYGTLGSAGYNLIGNNSGCTFIATTGDKVGTAAIPIDPRLTPLQPNGGLHLTHALYIGSPAMDAGNPDAPGSSSDACFAADQRGVSRPVGTRCDIGAFEGSLSQTYVPLVSTYTAHNDLSLPGVLVCNQADPNCTAGDPHARAAHRYALGISNLYAAHHYRNSINNSGMTIVSTVHYDSGYDNAFWSGEQMVYGDAYGFPLADDVVGHELTHGVTQHESSLFYYYQSGAINESFSDLWGEFYDQTNGQGNDAAGVKWQIGEDVSGLGALRDMRNPAAFGDPDKISSPHYYEGEEDSGGIHTNSGVNNKAVFLMVEGGSFNGKTVTALGWAKTAAIYYEASSNLLSSGADYSDLYYALLQACKNLLGQKGITVGNCSEVKDAIDAVEMNGQPAPNFNTESPFCPANLVPLIIFEDDLEAGTGNWSLHGRWQLDSVLGSYAKSGNHSLYADDYPGTVTDAVAESYLSIHIPENAYLRFDHAYGFETGYNAGDPTLYNFDGGVLEYSVLGGDYAVDAGPLIDYNGYKGVLFTGAGNPLSGRSAFVGSSHGYISTRLNLASLAGESVVFRWRMGLDEAVSAWGWWVDNVKVYSCVSSPGAFNKTFPSDGGSGIDLSTFLSWNTSLNAEYYEYCYDVINDNQCNRTWNTAQSFIVGISNLGPNTTYYWQVRAVNAAGRIEADNQNWRSFTTGSTLPDGTTHLQTFIGVTPLGSYSLAQGETLRENHLGMNSGPVKLLSTNGVPFVSAERSIYKINGIQTSFSEMMALPNNQLDTTYWLPWYNNVNLNTQLRIANATDNPTTVTVTIGGVEMPSFDLAAGESTRVSYAGVNDGPVQVVSDQKIVPAERVIYKVKGLHTSFSEMMALPESQLDSTYWLPWYNNVDLDTQLRIGNVSESTATVHVFIGEDEVTPASGITLLAGESTRVSFPGVNDGPVQIVSDQDIVAAERVIYKVQGVQTSFSEMMALPSSQVDNTYWLPWYNNMDLDTQLRFANVSNSPATVHVYINGQEAPGSPFELLVGESSRQSFFGINSGPVQIVSDVPIVAAERVIYKVRGVNTSFSEMMALPNHQLDTTYWLPWYNNVHLDTQLRFGVP